MKPASQTVILLLLAANFLGLGVAVFKQGAIERRNREIATMQADIDARIKDTNGRIAAMDNHPCGPTIQPGESCYISVPLGATTTGKVGGGAEEPHAWGLNDGDGFVIGDSPHDIFGPLRPCSSFDLKPGEQCYFAEDGPTEWGVPKPWATPK
jgi:hypothetical protein